MKKMIHLICLLFFVSAAMAATDGYYNGLVGTGEVGSGSAADRETLKPSRIEHIFNSQENPNFHREPTASLRIFQNCF
jgi:hypothetical protein